jgi:hypothetical protein
MLSADFRSLSGGASGRADIVTMLAVGLIFDKAMLVLRDRFPAWRESS